MKIVIENARPEQANELYDLMMSSVKSVLRHVYKDNKVLDEYFSKRDPGTLRDSIKDPENKTLIARSHEKIIGFAQLGVSFPTGFLEMLYVKPGFEGRGVGKSLLEEIKVIAGEHSLRDILLESTLNARRFYLASGFTIQGMTDDKAGYKMELILADRC
ncbi:MAG: GNAT family N-acetyltransferase [Desulfobacterales bacterium]|nr:GNAT family N-acetyltransferase [Desulfobacterales bacterium]